MARPVAITGEIFQVGGQGLTAPEDAAVYAILVHGRAALVDAGAGRGHRRLLDHLATVGVLPDQIDWLLLTHCHFDHTGGACDLRRQLRCPVVVHELDADYLERGDSEVTASSWYGAKIVPCPVDRRLRGERETLMVGDRAITALHIPGHSPGSVAYIVESEGKTVLFGQDIHGPLDPRLLSDRADYRRSLERLLALEADILCEGHYGVVRGQPEVAAFIRSFLETA